MNGTATAGALAHQQAPLSGWAVVGGGEWERTRKRFGRARVLKPVPT